MLIVREFFFKSSSQMKKDKERYQKTKNKHVITDLALDYLNASNEEERKLAKKAFDAYITAKKVKPLR